MRVAIQLVGHGGIRLTINAHRAAADNDWSCTLGACPDDDTHVRDPTGAIGRIRIDDSQGEVGGVGLGPCRAARRGCRAAAG
jgi:hypothetical protein